MGQRIVEKIRPCPVLRRASAAPGVPAGIGDAGHRQQDRQGQDPASSCRGPTHRPSFGLPVGPLRRAGIASLGNRHRCRRQHQPARSGLVAHRAERRLLADAGFGPVAYPIREHRAKARQLPSIQAASIFDIIDRPQVALQDVLCQWPAARLARRGVVLQTRICVAHPPDQAADAARLLGLPESAASLLPRLPVGEAIWRIGSRVLLVRHALSELERGVVDTDARMLPTTSARVRAAL